MVQNTGKLDDCKTEDVLLHKALTFCLVILTL